MNSVNEKFIIRSITRELRLLCAGREEGNYKACDQQNSSATVWLSEDHKTTYQLKKFDFQGLSIETKANNASGNKQGKARASFTVHENCCKHFSEGRNTFNPQTEKRVKCFIVLWDS